jgi:hypothetical protein
MRLESSDTSRAAGSSILDIVQRISGQVEIPLKVLFGTIRLLLVLIVLTVNLETRLLVVHVPSDGVSSQRPGQASLSPGRYEISDVAIRATPDLFLQPLANGAALATSTPGGTVEVPFYGTAISLIARVGPETGRVYVQIDGAPVESLSQDERGSYINLWDDRADETIRITEGLPHGEPVLTVSNGRSGQLVISGLFGKAATPFSWAFALIYLVLSACLVATIREIAVTAGKRLESFSVTKTFSIRRSDTTE